MPKPVPLEFTEAEIIEAIRKTNGNVAAVCKATHMGREKFQRYFERSPAIQTALYEAREEMLDMAETSLYNRVLAGDAWAVCFFLKTQGRKRGYIERAETFNLKIDLEKLTVDQLERLAAGEHPSLVLGAAAEAHPAGTGTTDPLTIEGTSRLSAETETDE